VARPQREGGRVTRLVPPLKASDLIGTSQYYRAVFDTVLPRHLVYNEDGIATNLWQTLYYSLEYLTPVNTPEVVPGQSVMVFDLRTFPAGARKSVSELANDLNNAKLSTSLFSLEHITAAEAYGESRAAAADRAQQASDEESLAHKVGTVVERLGWVLLALVVVIVIVVALKAYRAAR
jgi:hypothetical protein